MESFAAEHLVVALPSGRSDLPLFCHVSSGSNSHSLACFRDAVATVLLAWANKRSGGVGSDMESERTHSLFPTPALPKKKKEIFGLGEREDRSGSVRHLCSSVLSGLTDPTVDRRSAQLLLALERQDICLRE